MEQWEKELYKKLTNEHDETGETAALNHILFGDSEWDTDYRDDFLSHLRDRMETDSYMGGF